MNNYFRSGRYNRKLEQAYSYDKRKKELIKNKESNNEDREKEGKCNNGHDFTNQTSRKGNGC